MNNMLSFGFFKVCMMIFGLHLTMLASLPPQTENATSENWQTKVYTPNQLKQLEELRSKFSPEQLKDIKDRWKILITKAQNSVDQDPQSENAQQIAKEWMDLANEEYQDYIDLKLAHGLAYKNNQIPDSPFDPALWNFLEKAVTHMYQK